MSPDAGTADDQVLADVAGALYALAPEDFVAERNAEARRARQAGDRALATAIGGLPKPTVAAWLLNQLARRRPDAVEELVGLGDELRAAHRTLAGDQLRTVNRTRQAVVASFVRQVQSLAAELERPVTAAVSQQVEQTVAAAVAEDGAARALRSGRLTTGLTYAGLGDGEAAAPIADATRVADRAAERAAERQRQQQRREQVAALRRELERAEAELEAANEQRRQAQAALDATRRAADEASAVVDRVRNQLDDARD